jgi:dTDP-4-amino-4,6-dideoxygalactose transaminase
MGGERVVASNSWVVLLTTFLDVLRTRRPNRTEVVLAGYTCGEFVKSTLAAGLTPRFVDVDCQGRTPPSAIEAATSAQTLAVIGVNNVGVESDNDALAAVAEEAGAVFVEDATYTYLGRSSALPHESSKPPLGTTGHVSILNFSEGKLLPLGGGGMLLNDDRLAPEVEEVADRVREQRPTAEWEEVLQFLTYRLGASRAGYTLYRLVSDPGGLELKRLLSLEPTRTGERGQDLQGNCAAALTIPDDRLQAFADARALQPFNRVKAACGLQIIRRLPSIYRDRRERYDRFVHWAQSVPNVSVLPLADGGIPLRIPVVTERPLPQAVVQAATRYGLSTHYGTDYPMCGDPNLPNATRLYRQLYTVPVHGGATSDVLMTLLRLLERHGGQCCERLRTNTDLSLRESVLRFSAFCATDQLRTQLAV